MNRSMLSSSEWMSFSAEGTPLFGALSPWTKQLFLDQLEDVGDAFRPAIDHPMAASSTSDIEQVAQRHPLAPRHAQQRLVEGLAALRLWNFRHRGVKRIAGEVKMQAL